jgi:hypothetical protein
LLDGHRAIGVAEAGRNRAAAAVGRIARIRPGLGAGLAALTLLSLTLLTLLSLLALLTLLSLLT